MPDSTITFLDTREAYKPVKAVDNGDDTYSLGVALVGPGGNAAVFEEGTAHVDGDNGVQVLAVIRESPLVLADSDMLYQSLTVDTAANLLTTNPSVDGTNGLTKVARKSTRAAAAPITATGTHYTGAGTLERVIFSNTHTTNDVTLSIYDNTSAAGEKIMPDLVLAPKEKFAPEINAPFAIGLHIVVGGTGTFSGYAYIGPVIV